MGTIYFDNAATSWPKPPGVLATMTECMAASGGNPGRSGHRLSIAAARVVEETRQLLADLLNADDPSRIVFTHNATHALNVALYGLLRPGDHVVTTSVEHNSVMRPLRDLERRGIAVTVVNCRPEGTLPVDEVRRAMRPGTRLLVTTHASNVLGSVMPIEELAAAARAAGALYLVDASQSAGAVPIDIDDTGIDLLAFTGHKALLGPTGTGGLFIRSGVNVAPLIRGGTGSDSDRETQPDFHPDLHESGTLNVAGIAGLGAAVRFLREIGIDAVVAHERALMTEFVERAADIPGLTLYGPDHPARRCGVVSFNLRGASSSEVAQVLDDSFGILARAGLHCAPSAHRTAGTFPGGTVRFAFGWFNRADEIRTAISALGELASWVVRNVAWTV
jgi:cysteine desulfurase / selenocysteine lyase